MCLERNVHLENNTGTRGQYVSETKSPYYLVIVMLQFSEADIGCNNVGSATIMCF